MKPLTYCHVCKADWPCRIIAEDRIPHGTLSGYNHRCRCDACDAAYRAATGRAPRPGRPDDGIVDWVVVDRLVERTMPWQDATVAERKAAAARAFARGQEDAYTFAQDFLRLRSEAIKAVRADLAAWLEVAA